MLAESEMIEKIYSQAQDLSPEDRLRLIERIIRSLISSPTALKSQSLQFGEFAGEEAAMSSLEDFTIAEWQPGDEELNGT